MNSAVVDPKLSEGAMSERTYVFHLGARLRDAVMSALADPLTRAIPDDGMRAGLLEGLLAALREPHHAGAEPVPVTLRETPTGVEVEIARGTMRDTLVCTL